MASVLGSYDGRESLMEMSRDEIIQARIEVYRPLIIRDVNALELLSLMGTLLSREDKLQIRQLNRQGSEQCNNALLDIIQAKETPGRWQVFADALNISGYENLYSILTDNGDVVDSEHQRQIVKSLSLQEKIVPSDILPDLVSKQVLSETDQEEISAEERNFGQWVSAVMLIHRISKKSKTWFSILIEVLASHGYKEVAMRLENSEADPLSVDCTATDSSLAIDRNDFIERKVERFRELFTNNLKAMEIMNLIHFLTKEEKIELLQLSQRSEKEANLMLLDKIKNKDEPGKWQSLVDALRRAGYEQLCSALTVGTLENSEQQQKLIDLFSWELQDRLSLSEILPDLLAEKIFSEADVETIQAGEKTNGRWYGAIILIHLIPNKATKWFEIFLEVLDRHNYKELVDMLDPNFLEKKNAWKKARAIEDADDNGDDEFGTMEEYTSITGEAYISGNLCGAPGGTSTEKPFTMTKNVANEPDDITRLKINFRSENKIEGAAKSMPMEHDESLTETYNYMNNNVVTETIKQNLQTTNQEMQEVFGLTPETEVLYNIRQGDNMNSIIDNQSDNEEERNQATEELVLRDYQMELARPGLEAKNCIVVAPTGSGKTHVALKIIQDHLIRTIRRRIPRVIFIVEQSALADQQSKMCMKYLNCKVKVITGEVQRSENFQELSQWIKRYDVLVVTAQLLVNAFMIKDVDITDFSLIVFDECHHADSKHPYNRIMHRYLDLKLDSREGSTTLPQVVGLTASVGCGKAKGKEGAVNWVEKIMANLDAEVLVTVTECKGQLLQYVRIPEQTKVTVQERQNNLFGQGIINLMNMIEQYMVKSNYARQNPDCESIHQSPSQKGSELYTGWLSKFWRETAQISDREALNFFRTCRNYLEAYNKSLIIYADARVKDALDYLDQEVKQLSSLQIKNDIDNKLETVYQKSKSSVLGPCMYSEDKSNPKLDQLKVMLIKAYRENPESRGIVFVKTRDLAKAIVSWMRDTPGLKNLGPIPFVGREGMTKMEQTDALEFFRDGTHKIIVATSVAEEGLDIQSCNLVFRYDYATNEIAMVQARGRGRAEGSQYVAIVVEGGKAEKKEELNLMREALMQEAILCVQQKLKSNKEKFFEDQVNKQKLEKSGRDRKSKSEQAMREGEFSLRCGKCDTFICMSYDIRKIEDSHHVITAEDITRHIVATRSPDEKKKILSSRIQSGVGKVACKKCANDLGNVTVFKEVQFAVIKVKSFIIEDAYGIRVAKKKWNQVPFKVMPLSDEELQRIMASGSQLVDL